MKKYVRDEAGNLYEGLDKAEIYAAYVSKEEGKGLSSNDFTDAHKTTVENVQQGYVTGVKGDNEDFYRQGDVEITCEDIGASKVADIQDNLVNTSVDKPLSANQGKVLNETKINYTDVKNNLTSTDTNKPLSAAQGKSLNEAKADKTAIANMAEINKANNFSVSQILGNGTLRNLVTRWKDGQPRDVWQGFANSNGSFYLYDATNNKAILSSTAAGANSFNGDITGFANGISTFVDVSSTASLASGNGGVITARYPTGSLFFVMAKVAFAANTSGARSVGITTSGGSRILQKVSACSSGKTILTASDIVGYTSNGIGLWAEQNSGSTLSIEYELKIIRIR